MNNQLTAYIAQSFLSREEVETYVRDLTDRGFLCIYSDTIDDIVCTIESIKPESLAFFLFFADSDCLEFALLELGLALNTKATIVFIGPKVPVAFQSLIDGKKIISAYDYDNFIAQRFFDGGKL